MHSEKKDVKREKEWEGIGVNIIFLVDRLEIPTTAKKA
jgi:hypothetical protein